MSIQRTPKIRSRIQPKQGIELAAMVDVIFILVTYFLVNASLVNAPVLDVVLPKSLFAKHKATPVRQIYITTEQKIYLDREAVSLEQLSATLQTKNSDDISDIPQKIVIQADKNTTYEVLVRVMDELYRAGIDDFRLATEY